MPANVLVGTIRMLPYGFAPRGWLECNGQVLPARSYPDLFNAIGKTYGGDGVNTFQLPDLRGRVPMSFSTAHPFSQKGGTETHTLTAAEMAAHTHDLMTDKDSVASSTNIETPGPTTVLGRSEGKYLPSGSYSLAMYSDSKPTTAMDSRALESVGSDQEHENMQPFLALTFCIAYLGYPPEPDDVTT